MAIMEPWFVGVICGLAGLILVLVISITILCIVWSRKDKRNQKKKASKALHTSFTEIVAEQERQNPGGPKPRAISRNWLLKEPENPQVNVETNGKRDISGKEPFLVGTSLIKFSQELDKTRPSSKSQLAVPGTSAQASLNTEVDEEQKETKTPEKERKMIKLGLIPPRPTARATSDVSGMRPDRKHKPVLSGDTRTTSGDTRTTSGDTRTTSSDTRTTSEPSDPPLASGIQATLTNGLDALGNKERNWVSMKDREMKIWERSSSFEGRVNPGFVSFPALPKEDYDLKGVQWYEKNSDPLYDSHVQRLKEKFSSPKPAEHQPSAVMVQKQPRNYVRHNSFGGSGSSPAGGQSEISNNRPRSLMSEENVPSIWKRIPEDPEELKDEKINRVRRIGVPIFPD